VVSLAGGELSGGREPAVGTTPARRQGDRYLHDYFFSGDQYIRMTRVDTGPGTVDPGYPAPISHWGWGEFVPGPVSPRVTRMYSRPAKK
jgi:Hemopexin